jgi:hypothetical protein
LFGRIAGHCLDEQPTPGKGLAQPRGLVGIDLGFRGCFFLDKDMAFPGYWAIIPVTGTVLVLLAGMNVGGLNERLAGFPTFGCHWLDQLPPCICGTWPLLSFARILASQTPSAEVRIALLALSFVMASLTYRFVEKPIRFGQRYPHAVIWLSAWMVAACTDVARHQPFGWIEVQTPRYAERRSLHFGGWRRAGHSNAQPALYLLNGGD